MARSESSPDADPRRAGHQLERCRCAVRLIRTTPAAEELWKACPHRQLPTPAKKPRQGVGRAKASGHPDAPMVVKGQFGTSVADQ